ncbi:MAG: hypothetical protein WC974_09760 [Thermoplasmata archaeon]
MLFPALAGAISLDKSSYVMDQVADETIFIPNVSGIGGRFYNLTVPDFAMTVNGWSEMYELPSDFLIPGEYVLVDTNNSDLCGNLTLDECRADAGFLNEQSFSIKFPSPIPEKVEVPVPATEKDSLLDKALGFFLGLDDTATSTDTVTTETINTDSLANVISAVSDTTSTTSNNSSVATSTEEQTALIIVSDTNAASITSPLLDETATSTPPKETPTTSSVTGDTNTNGTTTTTF